MFDPRFLAASALALLTMTPGWAWAAAPDAPSGLPGGASSLQETYQDWSAACILQSGQRICSISQSQTQQNGRRLLAVELRGAADGSVAGTLLLPFGVLLENGVAVSLGDDKPLTSLPFRTCLPAGCVAVVKFDKATVAGLRQAANLKLAMTSEDGQPFTLSVSLKGFAAALDRIVALGSDH